MKKELDIFSYSWLFLPILATGFSMPLFILNEYLPAVNIQLINIASWDSVINLLKYSFILICTAIIILTHIALLLGLDTKAQNRKAIYVNSLGLLLASIFFFWTQDVGKNLNTIAFFICFNIYSYLTFYRLIFTLPRCD